MGEPIRLVAVGGGEPRGIDGRGLRRRRERGGCRRRWRAVAACGEQHQGDEVWITHGPVHPRYCEPSIRLAARTPARERTHRPHGGGCSAVCGTLPPLPPPLDRDAHRLELGV